MNVLSIVWGTCSTAAVLRDGEVVACASEERFSRIKNDDSYPYHAIEAVLAVGGVDSGQIDLVAFLGKSFPAADLLCHKWSRFSTFDRMEEQHRYWYPKFYEKKDLNFLEVFKDKIDASQYPGEWEDVIYFLKDSDQKDADGFFQEFRRRVVYKHLGIDPKKIIFTNHHFSHACYAYYASPIEKDKVLLLTADAWGDGANATVSIAEKGRIDQISSSSNFIIGRLYRYITLLLGMKPDEHEYKVMGLAAYSKPEYYRRALSVFENTMYIDGLGFAYHEKPADLYFYFKDKLEGFRFDSIAGAIQKYTEDTMRQWTHNALKMTGARTLCFGGGVAMNIKAIMEIAGLPELDEIFICPTPSDESLAIGAGYAAMHDICLSKKQDPRRHLKPLRNAYLGPESDPDETESVITQAKAKGYSISDGRNPGYVARVIADGKIVGRCYGRSEFGARALGNRSILADPRNPNVIKNINEKIKCRDFWMPFAPSILSEAQDQYLVNPKRIKAPYMTVAFETKPKAHEDLKAAIHQYDLTVRPQVVDKNDNPEYHNLISEYRNLTGIGALLNTSFNVHGEPIIQTPNDAFRVFERTNLDALMFDGCLVERNKKE